MSSPNGRHQDVGRVRASTRLTLGQQNQVQNDAGAGVNAGTRAQLKMASAAR